MTAASGARPATGFRPIRRCRRRRFSTRGAGTTVLGRRGEALSREAGTGSRSAGAGSRAATTGFARRFRAVAGSGLQRGARVPPQAVIRARPRIRTRRSPGPVTARSRPEFSSGLEIPAKAGVSAAGVSAKAGGWPWISPVHTRRLRAHPRDAERRPGDGGGRIGNAAGHGMDRRGMDHRGMDPLLDRRAGDEAEAIRSKPGRYPGLTGLGRP